MIIWESGNLFSLDGEEALIRIGWAHVLGWVGFAIVGMSGLVGFIMDND